MRSFLVKVIVLYCLFSLAALLPRAQAAPQK